MRNFPLAWALAAPALALLAAPSTWVCEVGRKALPRPASVVRALASSALDTEGLRLLQVQAGPAERRDDGWLAGPSRASNYSLDQVVLDASGFPHIEFGSSAQRGSKGSLPYAGNALGGAPQGLPTAAAAVSRYEIAPSAVAQPWPSYMQDPNAAQSVEAVWEENIRLRLEAVRLNEEVGKLRQEDLELRQEDSQLRSEDAQLRRSMAPARGLGTPWRSSALFSIGNSRAMNRRMVIGICAGLGSVVFVAIALRWCGKCFGFRDDDASESEYDDYEEEGSEESERKAEHRLRELVKQHGRQGHSLSRLCCCCCFNTQMACFSFSAIVSTALLGAALWKAGVLQPIIAEFGVYAYIALVLMCFVGCLIAELWQAFTTLLRYIMSLSNKMKSQVKGTLDNVKYTMKDLFDDGKLNKSVRVKGSPRWRGR